MIAPTSRGASGFGVDIASGIRAQELLENRSWRLSPWASFLSVGSDDSVLTE